MGISDELKKLGYEFRDKYGNSDERIEVWENPKAAMAVMIEWFRLPGVRP